MTWLDTLLKTTAEKNASDLHLSSGIKPMMRLDGNMVEIEGQAEATPAKIQEAFKESFSQITPKRFWEEYQTTNDTDFAYAIEGVGRFRCNLFVDANGPGGVFRVISSRIPAIEELGIPKAVLEFCHLKKGLVLITGPTGSGKSTTLAALINHINEIRRDHVITIEDPIEFIYTNKKCLINQRQVGSHTESFKNALRAALREDPDIVLLGEMRDLETVEIALEMAETGHLVFATLHTNTAISTIDRIIDQFPSGQQNQIRAMLASSLKAVVAQTLCKKVSKGRVAAYEVLIVNSAVSANIRDSKSHQITSMMQVGQALGMKLMSDALLEHVKAKTIEPIEAYLQSPDKKEMLLKLREANYPIDMSKLGAL